MRDCERGAGVRGTANRLRVAIGAFKRRVRETSDEGELSSPQLTALSRLDRLGPMTTAEAARHERISPRAMGATIASLENLGLVARSADAADARRSILTLTSEGLAAIHSGRNSVVDKVTAVLEEESSPTRRSRFRRRGATDRASRRSALSAGSSWPPRRRRQDNRRASCRNGARH